MLVEKMPEIYWIVDMKLNLTKCREIIDTVFKIKIFNEEKCDCCQQSIGTIVDIFFP